MKGVLILIHKERFDKCAYCGRDPEIIVENIGDRLEPDIEVKCCGNTVFGHTFEDVSNKWNAMQKYFKDAAIKAEEKNRRNVFRKYAMIKLVKRDTAGKFSMLDEVLKEYLRLTKDE